MEKDLLTNRRKGLEEAFFAEQDITLRRRLRAADETRAVRDALFAASGITDVDVLDRLTTTGITGETLAALSLVPLVAVAWADGDLDGRERAAALSGAERSGLVEGSAGHQLFAQWLGRRPPPELLATWKAYVAALSPTLNDAARDTLRADVLDRARAVAEAAGGFLGIGPRISEAERFVLEELGQAFAGRPH